jgi:hypothetical protein
VLDPMELFAHVFAEPTPQLREQRALLRAELEAEAPEAPESPEPSESSRSPESSRSAQSSEPGHGVDRAQGRAAGREAGHTS